MSGVVALWHVDGRDVPRTHVETMLATLQHRGPAGRGVWRDSDVGIGACSLGSTPEAPLDHLPVRAGPLVVAADVRLDGREHLGESLGQPVRGVSDEALLLAAYRRWGSDCPRHLLGDYAFVVWDGARRQLFGARDIFGLRPLHYHLENGRSLAVASEVKALHVLGDVPVRADSLRIATYLVPDLSDTTRTFYSGICRLPAAHAFVYDGRRLRLWRYWRPHPASSPSFEDAEYIQRFRDSFMQAVSDRLRASGSVGAMLSGGLDSTLVVACATTHRRRAEMRAPLPVFSAVFESVTPCDERTYIRQTRDCYGVKPHEVHPDRQSPLQHADAMLFHEEGPFYAPNLGLSWLVYEAAQRAGVRIVLDGYDGDSVLYQRRRSLAELLDAGDWRYVWGFTEGLAAQSGCGRPAALWRFGLQPLLKSYLLSLRRHRRRQHRRERYRQPWSTDPISAVSIIRPDFARRVGLNEWLAAARAERGEPPSSASARLAWFLEDGMFQYFMEIVDRAAAAFSLEARSPFFDRRVVEVSLALPPTLRRYRGWSRGIVRAAFPDLLPGAVCWRADKSDLTPALIRGLLFESARVERAMDSPGPLGDYVDLSSLRKAWERVVGTGDAPAALAVWRGLTLDLWLRSLASRQSRAPS